MPLAAVDLAVGTFRHICPVCGLLRTLSCDPAHGDLRVAEHVLAIAEAAACPACWRVRELRVSEQFDRWGLPHEAGEAHPPGSLVGTRNAAGTSIVTEHYIGGHGDPTRREQFRLIRLLQRHPALAPHAPLAETVHPHQWPDTVRARHRHYLGEDGTLLPMPTLDALDAAVGTPPGAPPGAPRMPDTPGAPGTETTKESA